MFFLDHHHHHKPYPGEIRAIHIEKSSEQLGIKIEEVQCQSNSSASGGGVGTSSGGVFVSSVSSNSLADQAGLQVGVNRGQKGLFEFSKDSYLFEKETRLEDSV